MVNGIIMNYNISANENYNKNKYVQIDQSYYTRMKDYIAQRRAEIIYQIELEEYNKRQQQQATADLAAWSESKD